MHLKVNVFAGMRPSLSTDLLKPGEAQQAVDVRLTAGELRPLNGLLANITLTAGGTIKSVYRFGQSLASITQYWFQSTGDVDYVKGPVVGDTTERTYFTDGTFPKKTDSTIATASTPYPSASYAMGIPAPAVAPTLAVSGSATNPSDPGEAVNYVMTYTSAWGEEGPPSLPSNTVTWRAGQTLNLTALSVAPGTGGAGQNYSVNGKRLYRSATGSQATQYQFVNNVALATTTYNDTAVTATLGDVLETLGWLEPAANMVGLCAGPNAVMAGFFGNTVCFSVPGVPYAWPVRYQQAVDAPVVGIAWFDQTLWVGTTMGQYLITGADPANMAVQKVATVHACVSKRSVVPMLGSVIFASSDGLYRMDANAVPVNLTADIFQLADWQAYVPSSITAYESDNRYVAFYDTGGTQASMIFTFGSAPSFVQSSVYATAGYRDKRASALFVVPSGGSNLMQYDGGSPLTYTWTSNEFHLPVEDCMACAIADASAYPLTFKLYADGVLVWTQTVANRYAFRLPSGYRSKRYHFNLSGTSIVREVKIASSMFELTLP